jgi:hypothetical protein
MATTETALGLEVTHEVVEPLSARAVESVLLNGDLKALSAEERVVYYQRVCDSVGLNYLTQPFQYIVLNGKLTLYARRDCTEQLRKLHGVSVSDMTTELIGDVYVVRASFTDKTGRTDQATGAVPIKGLQGENLANAYLKAETKCKRRGTLSICGLGILDETEVDSIPGAKPEGPPRTPFTPPRRKAIEPPAERLHAPPAESSADELPPLSDAELAALDTEDARAQEVVTGEPTSGPPKSPEPAHSPVAASCISSAQVKRAHGILGLACKGNEAAAKLARAQLYLQLTKHAGVVIEDFAHIPKAGDTYTKLCDEWIDKAAMWALRHVEKK